MRYLHAKPVSDTYTIDELGASILGVQSVSVIREHLFDQDFETEDECDDFCAAYLAAHRSATVDTLDDALFAAEIIMRMNDEHVTLSSKDWANSARLLIGIINDVGYFHFNNLREAIASGPYRNAKEFALKHIGWLNSYPEIYGGPTYKAKYERAFEYELRREGYRL